MLYSSDRSIPSCASVCTGSRSTWDGMFYICNIARLILKDQYNALRLVKALKYSFLLRWTRRGSRAARHNYEESFSNRFAIFPSSMASPQQDASAKRPDSMAILPVASQSSDRATYQAVPAAESTLQDEKPAARTQPAVRYRKTPIWLAGIYLTTLIVPWILTCILDKRPLTATDYYDQRGDVSPERYLAFFGVLALVNVLKVVSAVLTIPITTAILAYTSVTYCQRRRADQELSITQLFALSDRGWSDLTILWHSGREGRSSQMLWLGALLVAIGTFPPP